MTHPDIAAGIWRVLVIVTILLAPGFSAPARAQYGGARHTMMLENAKKGDAESQYMLGLSYASGFGVERNVAQAVKWYRKAAEQGLAIAQKNLAALLGGGQGIAPDYVEAYKWYEVSIPNLPDAVGRSVAASERDALVKNMTPENVSEARRLAAQWFREHGAGAGMTPPSSASSEDNDAEKTWSCAKEPVKGPTSGLWLNPCLLDLPAGKWTMIHRQSGSDAVRFRLQDHAGSAFDTRRGRIVLFGSDTHDALHRHEPLINGPLLFEVARLRWMRFYPPDPIQTYTVNRWGVPVAGYAHNHPWAMHTYGAVEYDPRRDEIIVSSHPAHLRPGRFTDIVAHLWPYVKGHPTWILSFRTNRWSTLPTQPESFFRYATTFDSDRGVVIGHRKEGVFELGGKYRKWRRVSQIELHGAHSNSVYDSKHKAVVIFGSGYDTGDSNDVVVFWPGTRRHRVMPTPGVRPRPDAHVPMAYHPKQERTVVVVDEDAMELTSQIREHSSAQTWLYDLERDRWTLVESARMPLGLGMNYNMVYDPGHNILLLVAAGKRNRTTVWALRL